MSPTNHTYCSMVITSYPGHYETGSPTASSECIELMFGKKCTNLRLRSEWDSEQEPSANGSQQNTNSGARKKTKTRKPLEVRHLSDSSFCLSVHFDHPLLHCDRVLPDLPVARDSPFFCTGKPRLYSKGRFDRAIYPSSPPDEGNQTKQSCLPYLRTIQYSISIDSQWCVHGQSPV